MILYYEFKWAFVTFRDDVPKFTKNIRFSAECNLEIWTKVKLNVNVDIMSFNNWALITLFLRVFTFKMNVPGSPNHYRSCVECKLKIWPHLLDVIQRVISNYCSNNRLVLQNYFMNLYYIQSGCVQFSKSTSQVHPFWCVKYLDTSTRRYTESREFKLLKY